MQQVGIWTRIGGPRECKALLMAQRKFIRVRSDSRRRGRYLLANPLWPLEELRDLRNPPFVADPEFTPFDVAGLRCDPKSAPASPSDSTQVRPTKRRRLHTVRREFPIPQLVAGLPWRFTQRIKLPVVSEVEFASLDLSYIVERVNRAAPNKANPISHTKQK